MIFQKGEIVRVKDIVDESVMHLSGKVGRVFKIGDLDGNTPFLVYFFINDKMEKAAFSYMELELLDKFKDDEDRQHFIVQIEMHSMREKT